MQSIFSFKKGGPYNEKKLLINKHELNNQRYGHPFIYASIGFLRPFFIMRSGIISASTKNGEGDLVVMDINAYDQREKQLELREKLVEIEELRKAGATDIPAHTASQNLRALLREKAYVQN